MPNAATTQRRLTTLGSMLVQLPAPGPKHLGTYLEGEFGVTHRVKR